MLRTYMTSDQHTARARTVQLLEIRATLNQAITAQTRTIMFAMVASNLTLAGLAFAAASLR